jgi:hypothetical protein
MHSLVELKLGLTLPGILLSVLWVTFLTRFKRERTRTSAWFALLLTSSSGIAGLWAVANLGKLWNRSITDTAYEWRAWALAVAGFVAAFIWMVRSRNLYAAGTLLIALWLSFIWSLSY